MSGFLGAILTVFGLGVVYFVACVPVGVGLGLNPFVAAAAGWAGYTTIAAVMLLIGAPARKWFVTKLKIPAEPDPTKLFWRIWIKYGLPGLALLAPVTCGPYVAALVAIALGEKPRRLIVWIALGAIPFGILFALGAMYFPHLLPKK